MPGKIRSVARKGVGVGTRFFLAAILGAFLAMPIRAAQGPTDAGAFLADLSERAMAELSQADLAEAEKERRFRVLMREGFDVNAIGRFVLGRYWRKASPHEQQEFLIVFEDSMVFRFLPILGDYTGDVLQVGAVRPFGQAPNIFSVESQLQRKEGPPVHVDWRVYKRDEGYRILDVVAEGVSVAVTLRSEYGSVLKQNGGNVSALSSTLREKMAGLR